MGDISANALFNSVSGVFFTVKVRFFILRVSLPDFEIVLLFITRDQMFKGIYLFKDVISNTLLALSTNRP